MLTQNCDNLNLVNNSVNVLAQTTFFFLKFKTKNDFINLKWLPSWQLGDNMNLKRPFFARSNNWLPSSDLFILTYNFSSLGNQYFIWSHLTPWLTQSSRLVFLTTIQLFDWLPSFNLTFWASPCLSAKISTIHAISQWFWWCESSFNRTISLVWKLLLFFEDFWHCWRVSSNSLCDLFQNFSVICCTLLHCLWQYISAHPNSPGEGITTLVFIVNILKEHIGLRLLP